jgi:hypothetical protein
MVGCKSGSDVLVVAPHVPDFDRCSGSLRFYRPLPMLARRYGMSFREGGSTQMVRTRHGMSRH